MGLIWGTVLSVLGVTGAILIPVTARVVGDDVKEWLPWITRRLVQRAVSRLPEEERERFEEEWWAHINELPGNLAKLYAAWGYLSASKAISHIALSGDTTSIEKVVRRVMDVTVSVLSLLFVLPLMLVISISIKLDSRGPVLLEQKRLGANNIPFYLRKFRSMYVEVPGGQLEETGYPRVTRVGRFIRQTSLDELPQLLNVLRGEMSLVGPLPLPPPTTAYASAKGESPIIRRLKPGITGWAQINSWKGEAETLADVYYEQNRSLIFDILIIVRAVFRILSRDSVALAPISFGFFLYILCLFLIGLGLALSCLIGLMAVITCLLGLVSAIVSLIPAMTHWLGYL